MTRHQNVFVLNVAIWTLAAATAYAQGQAATPYPNRPVKIIAPQVPGGGVDLAGRIVADRLGRATGQSFMIENLAGAGGRFTTSQAIHINGGTYLNP